MEALVEYKYDKGADIRKERGKEEVREMFATAIEKALKKREKIGIQKGIQRGMKKGKEETAKKMLENGANIEFIKAVTGLSEEEIEKLK
jgi:predicted transposase/invertase (TIGR01784 family)